MRYINLSFRKYNEAPTLFQRLPCFFESPESRNFTFPVYGNIYRIKENFQDRIASKFILSHKMKLSFGQDTKKHDVQIGGMIGTVNIGLVFIQRLFIGKAEKDPSQPAAEDTFQFSQFI
jgi:hypothetical protein